MIPFLDFVCKIRQYFNSLQEHAPKKWTNTHILKTQIIVYQQIKKNLSTRKSGQNIEV